MEQERTNLGFGDELDSFDPSEWTAPKKQTPRLEPEVAKKAAVATGFKSREPDKQPVSAAPQRRRRTGRNAQFNIKARPETIEAFCEVADGQGWGLGETLEHAVELLKQKFPSKP